MDLPDDDRALADLLTDTIRKRNRCSMDPLADPGKCSETERTAFTVWESCAMISSGGFLLLIENEADLGWCANSYQRVGLHDVAEVFREVMDVIPDRFKNRRYEDIGVEFADLTEDETVYDRFRALDRRYFHLAGDRVAEAVGAYVRQRRDQLTL